MFLYTLIFHRHDGKMNYRECGKRVLKLPATALGASEPFGGCRGETVVRECMLKAGA